ncbi:DUF6894 family protein [Microvirga arabica]|uniref:DUF6894 family protein n=1 Tax=Microvirga arabica TaxID=1128671 RepID=UPI001939DF54|nr:hypothetical protein [Microvirga arabica]MBM1170039.1 hypothetical protein [Microvirga arabica]
MRYHFYISDGERLYIDSIGVELPSPSAAIDRAWGTASQLMLELATEVPDWTKWRLQIIDEEQGDCLILPFYYIQRSERLLRGSPRLSGMIPCELEQKFWC